MYEFVIFKLLSDKNVPNQKFFILGNFWKSIDFAFEVKFANVTHLQNTADCNSYICPMFRIPERYCERYCPTVIKNYAKVNCLNAFKVFTK